MSAEANSGHALQDEDRLPPDRNSGLIPLKDALRNCDLIEQECRRRREQGLASRLLFDNIQKQIDRDYAASFARQQQRALKTNHQGFFWAPGQNAPGRAPDAGSAFE